MEVSNYLKKFELLLDYVFKGKVVLNENNTENLLKLLEDRSDNSPGKTLIDNPRCSDLIFNSIENIPNTTPSFKIFIIKVITILFKNELQFSKMHLQGFQSSSIKYCILANLNTKNPNPLLHMACIHFATVQITHCSGIKLLLKHKIWEYILYPNIHQRPINIGNAAYNFISQLIRKLNEYEMEAELIEVLEYVVKPINTSEYLTLQIIDHETDKALANKIYTQLQALLNILNETEDVVVNHIVPILKTYFIIEHALYTIVQVTRYSNLLYLINDVCLRFQYATSRHLLFSNKVNEFCNEMVVFYHNCLLLCMKKRDIRAITDFVVKCNLFWSKFEKIYKDRIAFPLTFERNGQKLELTNQLTVHLIEPLLIYAFNNIPEGTVNEAAENILEKIGKTVTEHIFSSCYLYRTLIGGNDLKQIAIETIRELFKLKGHLTPSQAGIVFQSLYHLLNLYILPDETGALILNENPVKCPNDVRLLSLVLDALHMLLKEHNISWYENIEIVSLQEGLMNLLNQNILNTKQLVKVLDLIDICVKKFLSPNMKLLVESHQDSTLSEIGAVMKLYMNHEDWEARDSALNLLLSCTNISFIKYIPLQKVISENNLMIIAAKMALTDPEYYAQSTGLRCLAAATKIESIWREVFVDNPQIYIQLVYILRNNPEGIVREEAANVLTGVYTNQKVLANFQSTLYAVMMSAALDDLHWEVQLAALQFWKHAVKDQLTYRGMYDGQFPPVTFSKEKRKIITLDEREITRQLNGIMNHLSSIGCLTVLYECLKEVYNIEIVEKAYYMAKELIEILDKYKYTKVTDLETTYPPEEQVKENDEAMAIDLTNTANKDDFRDKIIESILSTDQSELLMNLHDNNFQTKSDDMEDFRLCISQREMVEPNKFLQAFEGTDYLSIINDKKKWNLDVSNSLDVLLDDLLNV